MVVNNKLNFDYKYFNSQLSVGKADKALANFKNADSIIHGAIRDVFVKYGVCDTLGVALLHSHFPLSSDEILVETGGTAVPWDMGREGGSEVPGRRLVPTNWAFHEGKTLTTQFALADNDPHDIPAPFFSELQDVLTTAGLVGLLGVAALPGKFLVEITRGRANLTFPSSTEALENFKTVQTLWCFDPKNPSARLCGQCCVESMGDHNE